MADGTIGYVVFALFLCGVILFVLYILIERRKRTQGYDEKELLASAYSRSNSASYSEGPGMLIVGGGTENGSEGTSNVSNAVLPIDDPMAGNVDNKSAEESSDKPTEDSTDAADGGDNAAVKSEAPIKEPGESNSAPKSTQDGGVMAARQLPKKKIVAMPAFGKKKASGDGSPEAPQDNTGAVSSSPGGAATNVDASPAPATGPGEGAAALDTTEPGGAGAGTTESGGAGTNPGAGTAEPSGAAVDTADSGGAGVELGGAGTNPGADTAALGGGTGAVDAGNARTGSANVKAEGSLMASRQLPKKKQVAMPSFGKKKA